MSVTIHIEGVRKPDEEFSRMLAVWKSCQAANISPPKEVLEFFGYAEPDERGLCIDMKGLGCGEIESDEGWEIKVCEIPSNLKVIRVYMQA